MRRAKRVLTIAFGVLLALALVFVVSARRFIFKTKLDVVSIATSAEYQDPERLRRAFALPVASRYEAGSIAYQTNGSLCGPTSVANVMRSFDAAGEDAKLVLDGTGKCSLGVCFGGLTLDELADIARAKTKHNVTVLRDLSLEQFREHMARANSTERRYIVNFDRGPLFGTVGGHHSPIGGYLADEDLVLVLDVNAQYKPWLVKAERLYRAMDTADPSSEKKRGLLLIE